MTADTTPITGVQDARLNKDKNPLNQHQQGENTMPSRINRRQMLKASAVAGAGVLFCVAETVFE